MPQRLAETLIRKHEGNVALTTEVRSALIALPVVVRNVKAGALVVREGIRPTGAIVIIDGCLFRHKVVADGKRQIFSFQIAGDMPDLQSLFLKQMDHSITALDDATIGIIPHVAVLALLEKSSDAAQLLWRDTLLDAAIFREWIANTGRRQAVSRVAHLICELVRRGETVGLTHNKTYHFDGTQAHYADAVGLSLVHVNRALKKLRADGLIEWDRPIIKVLDWVGLTEVGDFDDAYLEAK
jgi:CRP-like cAMP-binding protein